MKNHYDTLNLGRNCSSKDIKDAFVRLSKKYHPDKNKDCNAHIKFIQVIEAYSVLGKAFSREAYDQTLRNREAFSSQTYSTGASGRPFYNNFYEYSHYYKVNENFKSSKPSYLNKRNITLVIFCCMFLSFGSGFISQLVKQNTLLNSEVNAAVLSKAKERAKLLTKEEIIKQIAKNDFERYSYSKIKKQLQQRK